MKKILQALKKVLAAIGLAFLLYAFGEALHMLVGSGIQINTFNAPVKDTLVVIGDSYSNGVGGPSVALGFPTLMANKLSAIAKIHGTNGEVMENRSPINPFSAAVNNGVQDTAAVSNYNNLMRALVIELGTNDATYSNTNYTTANFVADYTTYLHHCINVAGWPASKILLVGVGYEATTQLLADSVIYSLPVAPTQARFNSFDSCIRVLATTFGCKFFSIRTPWMAWSNNTPQLLQATDSIHPNSQEHLIIADELSNALGYDIKMQGQAATINSGLTEVDSLKIRLLNPIVSNTFSNAVIDTAGNLRAGENMFLLNNPVTPQTFIGNITQGIVSHWSQPDFIRITANAPIANQTALGTVLTGDALEFQHNSSVGYIDDRNRTANTGSPLVIGSVSAYVTIGAQQQLNSAIFDVNGISQFSTAAWFTDSTGKGLRILKSGADIFLDQESLAKIKFRTNGAAYNALTLLEGGIQFPGSTTQLALDTTNYSLAVLKKSDGTFIPMAWQVPSGGGGGASPGGSNQNVQVKSGSSFFGAGNLNYDTTNAWTLIGATPLVETGTGTAVAGDLVIKANTRLFWSAAATGDIATIGVTSGLVGEFRNYFKNGAVGAWDFYVPGAGATGAQDLTLRIGTDGVISTGTTGNPGYSTPVSGDIFMKYGGRIISGSGSTQWSSISANHAGLMEFMDSYSSGSVDFYVSKGTAGSTILTERIDVNGHFLIDSTAGKALLTVGGAYTGAANGALGIQSSFVGTSFIDNSTAVSGTVTDYAVNAITASHLLATNASVTYTNAASLYISGAPIAGANVTIGTAYSLKVAAGASYFGGNVNMAQGVLHAYVAKTGNYSVALTDFFIDCTSNSFTITLPTAVGITGECFEVKNSGTATTITIATASSQTIDGSAPTAITTAIPLRVMSDGANWKTW